MQVNLTHETIDKYDIDGLISWLQTNPRLTKGEQTEAFEKEFAEYIGCKYAVYVNSGSSANLLMLSVLRNRVSNLKVIVPILSWATDVAPILQLGFEPVFIGYDEDTLQPNYDNLVRALTEGKEAPSVFLCVSALGLVPRMQEIKDICDSFGTILLEDNCESLGAGYDGVKLGNFGLMSSFSFYFSHHISSVEGGMITTNNYLIYQSLLCQRSHGWLRDLPEYPMFEKKMGIKAKYHFIDSGYNLRATDIQARIGRGQLKKLPDIVKTRNSNYALFNLLTEEKNAFKYVSDYKCELSSFAMPILLHFPYGNMSELLTKNEIEHRPLICGDISQQPFVARSGDFKNYASEQQRRILNNNSIYLPNHIGLTEAQIEFMASIFNKGVLKNV